MAHYQRVIPRDLFNEGNLLTCYGKLWINIEKLNNSNIELVYVDGKQFDIHQNPQDGSLRIENVELCIKGEVQTIYRPLNSRDKWPLVILPDGEDQEEIFIFNEDGEFSEEFLEYADK